MHRSAPCAWSGPLESAYERCLAHELTLRGVQFEQQKPLPVVYKGIALEYGYRLNFLIERVLVVEVKAVERLLPIHQAQLLTYLKLADVPIGLLVNFHSPALREGGLRRLTNR